MFDAIGGQGGIVNAALGDEEIMYPARRRPALWVPLAPAFLKSPTSSFCFVSTEMTGCPAAWNRRPC